MCVDLRNVRATSIHSINVLRMCIPHVMHTHVLCVHINVFMQVKVTAVKQKV